MIKKIMEDTIKEDYVSFELAKLLKEKGFNEPCHSRYYKRTLDGEPKVFDSTIDGDFNNADLRNTWSRPTHQMAMQWLRKKHDLHVEVRRSLCTYLYGAIMMRGTRYDYRLDKFHASYEQAVEAALKYALENLM